MKRYFLMHILLGIAGAFVSISLPAQSYTIDQYISGNGGTITFGSTTDLEAGDWVSNKENPDLEVGLNSIYFPPLWLNEPVVYRVKYSVRGDN